MPSLHFLLPSLHSLLFLSLYTSLHNMLCSMLRGICGTCSKIQLWSKNVEKSLDKIEQNFNAANCRLFIAKLAILQLINSVRRWRLCLLIGSAGKSCNCQFTWPKSCGSNRNCSGIDFLPLLSASISLSLSFPPFLSFHLSLPFSSSTSLCLSLLSPLFTLFTPFPFFICDFCDYFFFSSVFVALEIFCAICAARRATCGSPNNLPSFVDLIIRLRFSAALWLNLSTSSPPPPSPPFLSSSCCTDSFSFSRWEIRLISLIDSFGLAYRIWASSYSSTVFCSFFESFCVCVLAALDTHFMREKNFGVVLAMWVKDSLKWGLKTATNLEFDILWRVVAVDERII